MFLYIIWWSWRILRHILVWIVQHRNANCHVLWCHSIICSMKQLEDIITKWCHELIFLQRMKPLLMRGRTAPFTTLALMGEWLLSHAALWECRSHQAFPKFVVKGCVSCSASRSKTRITTSQLVYISINMRRGFDYVIGMSPWQRCIILTRN